MGALASKVIFGIEIPDSEVDRDAADGAEAPDDFLTLPVRLADDAYEPKYENAAGAAMVLYAADRVRLEPGDCAEITTGVEIDVPPFLMLDVRSYEAHSGLVVVPQIYDSGSSGPIKVLVVNHSSMTKITGCGGPVARLYVQPRLIGNDLVTRPRLVLEGRCAAPAAE